MDYETLPPPYTDENDSPPAYEVLEELSEPTISVKLHFRVNSAPYLAPSRHAAYNANVVNISHAVTFDELQRALQEAIQQDPLARTLNSGWKFAGLLYTRPSQSAMRRGVFRATGSILSQAFLGVDLTLSDEEVYHGNWEDVLGRLWSEDLEGLSLVVWPVRTT